MIKGEHEKTIRRVKWSPDGKFLASCSFDGTVGVWEKINLEGKSELKFVSRLEGQENEVSFYLLSYLSNMCIKYI